MISPCHKASLAFLLSSGEPTGPGPGSGPPGITKEKKESQKSNQSPLPSIINSTPSNNVQNKPSLKPDPNFYKHTNMQQTQSPTGYDNNIKNVARISPGNNYSSDHNHSNFRHHHHHHHHHHHSFQNHPRPYPQPTPPTNLSVTEQIPPPPVFTQQLPTDSHPPNMTSSNHQYQQFPQHQFQYHYPASYYYYPTDQTPYYPPPPPPPPPLPLPYFFLPISPNGGTVYSNYHYPNNQYAPSHYQQPFPLLPLHRTEDLKKIESHQTLPIYPGKYQYAPHNGVKRGIKACCWCQTTNTSRWRRVRIFTENSPQQPQNVTRESTLLNGVSQNGIEPKTPTSETNQSNNAISNSVPPKKRRPYHILELCNACGLHYYRTRFRNHGHTISPNGIDDTINNEEDDDESNDEETHNGINEKVEKRRDILDQDFESDNDQSDSSV